MLRLMKERESINVVDDQLGCPTYAADLADAIMTIVGKKSKIKNQKSELVTDSQVFNYCNEGVINWYQFALAIKELSGSNCVVNPIPTIQYPTPAKRAAYTALDTTLIKNTFGITIPQWKDSLKNCLKLM